MIDSHLKGPRVAGGSGALSEDPERSISLARREIAVWQDLFRWKVTSVPISTRPATEKVQPCLLQDQNTGHCPEVLFHIKAWSSPAFLDIR